MRTIIKILSLFSFLLLSANIFAQQWQENSGREWDYDLSKFNILTIVFDGFNYEEAVVITNFWKKRGANVEFAGTKKEHSGEMSRPDSRTGHEMMPATIKTDLLIDDINLTKYNLIYFSGGEGVVEFLNLYSNKLQMIIDSAANTGIVIASICHGPYILSSSDMIKGHKITVQGNNFKNALIKKGAEVVNEIIVNDGPFITGQWPFFETFAVTVSEKLAYPSGGGPFELLSSKDNIFLNKIINQRNPIFMKPGDISNDTIEIITQHSVNPLLPFEMPNNQYIRFVAVKNAQYKQAMVDEMIKIATNKYRASNIPPDALKNWYTMIFSAPVIILVYNDTDQIPSTNDAQDKEILLCLSTVLAGQSVSQMGLAANEMGLSISNLSGLRTFIGRDGFIKVLKLPESYSLCAIIGIGHPAELANRAVVRPVNEYLEIK